MRAALAVEWLKVRRSPVTLTATLLMGLLLPAMGLGFYFVARDGGSGPLAGKAGALLTGEGWVGYLGLVSQIAAVAVFLGVGVVVAWVFGREHTDRTFPALFARPVSTATVAAAKFGVMTLWIFVLAIVLGVIAVVLGLVGGVATSEPLALSEVGRLLGVSLASAFLGLTMGYVASVGRGYLPAISALIVVIAIAQVAVLFGTGGWFPFAVPGLIAVAGSDGIVAPATVQILLVPALVSATIWLTVRWWRIAEVV